MSSFSFGIKKINVNKIKEHQHTSENLSNVFEKSTEDKDNTILSVSTLKSIGLTGFQEDVHEQYQKEELIIPCKNKLSNLKTNTHSNIPDDVTKEKHCQPLYIGTNSADIDNSGFVISKDNVDEVYNEMQSEPPSQAVIANDDVDLVPDIDAIMNWRESNKKETIQSNANKPLLARNNVFNDLRKKCADSSKLFQEEMKVLPEFSLDSYRNVKVEDFGLAMLRGMGYDPALHQTLFVQPKHRVYVHAGLGADKHFETLQKQNKTSK